MQSALTKRNQSPKRSCVGALPAVSRPARPSHGLYESVDSGDRFKWNWRWLLVIHTVHENSCTNPPVAPLRTSFAPARRSHDLISNVTAQIVERCWTVGASRLLKKDFRPSISQPRFRFVRVSIPIWATKFAPVGLLRRLFQQPASRSRKTLRHRQLRGFLAQQRIRICQVFRLIEEKSGVFSSRRRAAIPCWRGP